jgi:hypothetical protein
MMLTSYKIYIIVNISLILLSIISCDKETDITSSNIYFKGIVQTDTEGNIISEDYEDWQPRQRTGWVYDSLYSRPAYPNPAGKDSVQIDFQSPKFLGCIISYTLPRQSLVTVTINNRPDQIVRTLFNESEKQAGTYVIAWDLKNDVGNLLPSGIYRVYITAQTNYFGKVIETYGDIKIYK